MRKLLLIPAAVVLLGVLAAGRGAAYPKPEDSAAEDRWTLDIRFRPVRMISVTDRVTGKKVLYWYLLYTVANNTQEQTVRFNPDFTLLTDANQVYRDVLDLTAFEAIKRRHQDMLLENPIEIAGPLHHGEGFAKDGVAIFRDIDRDVDAFKIFVSGISDDVQTVVNPITGEQTSLYKTLERSYQQPGDQREISRDKIYFIGERYIYR